MLKVSDIMRHCRNHFICGYRTGDQQIQDGKIRGDDTLPLEWIAIDGSRSNNGVHQADQNGCYTTLTDETWHGTVWYLSPPQDFLDLCEEIIAYAKEHPVSEIKSEQFGTYRYVKKDGVIPWQTVFAEELRPWQHMVMEVQV